MDAATVAVRRGFAALEPLLAEAPFVAGPELSLADLHLAPLIDYLSRTPGGAELIAPHERLKRWWAGIAERPSILATGPDLAAFRGPEA